MKNICASCKSVNVKSIIKTDNNKLPKWLQKTDYVSKFIEKTPLKLYKTSALTLYPFLSNSSTRWEPIKPSAPVTKIFDLTIL